MVTWDSDYDTGNESALWILPETYFLELAAALNLQIVLLKGPHLTSSKNSLKQATSSGLSVFIGCICNPMGDSYQACLLSFIQEF